jgi:hypothetical protein
MFDVENYMIFTKRDGTPKFISVTQVVRDLLDHLQLGYKVDEDGTRKMLYVPRSTPSGGNGDEEEYFCSVRRI